MRPLEIKEFGTALITSGDLDPVYIAVHEARLTPIMRDRFLVAYWCFYHCGVSAWIADQANFWDAMLQAAVNNGKVKSFPRGTERRHFRGNLACKSVTYLSRRYFAASEMVGYICGERSPARFVDVYERACEHIGFGPWIAFKIADMIDRCGVSPVRFNGAEMFMFKDPTLGADLYRTKYNCEGWSREEVVKHLVEMFSCHKAPPMYDRPISVAEIETCLCKWKSHLNGHYPIGKDIKEVLHGLVGWGKTADKLHCALTGHVQCIEDKQL